MFLIFILWRTVLQPIARGVEKLTNEDVTHTGELSEKLVDKGYQGAFEMLKINCNVQLSCARSSFYRR